MFYLISLILFYFTFFWKKKQLKNNNVRKKTLVMCIVYSVLCVLFKSEKDIWFFSSYITKYFWPLNYVSKLPKPIKCTTKVLTSSCNTIAVSSVLPFVFVASTAPVLRLCIVYRFLFRTYVSWRIIALKILIKRHNKSHERTTNKMKKKMFLPDTINL